MGKLRIVHIVKTFDVGGVESIVKDLSNKLDDIGYQVFILSLEKSDNSMRLNLNPNVRFVDLGFDNTKNKNPTSFFYVVKKIYNILSEIKPDILNSHLYFIDLFLVTLALKLIGHNIAHVRTIHSSGGFYEQQKSLANKFRLFLEIISSKIYMSSYIGVSRKVFENNELFFGKYCHTNKLIYNFIDVAKFSKIKTNISAANRSNQFKVVYIARLELGKNHLLALKVLAELKNRGLDVEFTFAGSGSLKCYLESEARLLGVDSYVSFLGNVDNVPNVLKLADIAIFPSEYEGFSVVLLEKMASRLPVICSGIDAFLEVIVNTENGYIAKHPIEYVEIIERLYFDKDERLRVGEKAFITAKSFSIDTALIQYNDFYIDCLSVFK